MRRFTPVLATVLVTALGARLASPEEDSPKEAAMEMARKARRAEKEGRSSEAFLLYSEAYARRPKEKKYKSLMDSLKGRAEYEAATRLLPKGGAEQNAPEAAYVPDAPGPFDSLTAREFANARQPQAPPALDAQPSAQAFDLNEPARTLFDRVAERFGLRTIYDSDYPASGPPVRFRITPADYREALHDLEAATGSFVIPLSTNLFMVAQDTPQKRNELEQTMAVSIPIPQAVTPQELTEIAQAVRQSTNIEKLAWNTAQSEIVIRDRVSRVVPAQALMQQLFSMRTEIMMEVEFLEVSDSDTRNYGFNVTNSFQAIYLGQILHNAISVPAGIANLLTFGGGKTLFGLGVAQVQALFNQTTSSARTLFRTQVRSSDGQTATLHAGQKYPIVTSGYSGSATGAQTASNFSLPPAFTFEDLGVNVKVTPRVNGSGDMTLSVDTSFEILTGTAVNGLPVIGRRQFTTQVRLRNDEWAVVAGLMNTSHSKTVSGFFGLERIPLLGRLFKQTSTDKEDSHILVVIKPHLLSLPPDQIVTHSLRVGSETRPFTPL